MLLLPETGIMYLIDNYQPHVHLSNMRHKIGPLYIYILRNENKLHIAVLMEQLLYIIQHKNSIFSEANYLRHKRSPTVWLHVVYRQCNIS